MRFFSCLAFVLLSLITACVHAQAPPQPVRVVATFSILADMVREVGGGHIDLKTIVGPNGDAHAFEPTPRDARALGNAQVLVSNGLGFEGWLPRLQQASGFNGLEVVASTGVRPRSPAMGQEDGEKWNAAAVLQPTFPKPGSLPGVEGRAQAVQGHDDHDHHNHADGFDPHAWQDLANGVIYVRNIARGLAQVDPRNAAEYQRRAQAYVDRLQQEDTRWRSALAAIPAARRVMMTSHDAFGYLGQAYGIELIPVLGLSSEAEPSARDVAWLIDQIRARGIRAIFLEKAVNPMLMQRIARETGVHIGGVLYSDTLDEPGKPAGTYLGMFRWNTRQILAAFGG